MSVPTPPKAPCVRVASIGLLMVLCGFGPRARDDIPSEIKFNRDVRPILSNSCYNCHGPDKSSLKADLRLDIAELALAPREGVSGYHITPIVPGSPEQSEVWRRVNAADPDEVMPPVDTIHQLSERQKAIIYRWIEQGAEFEEHWAYIPPVKVDPPETSDSKWVSNPIDNFILKKLDEHGLEPSPRADRATLIRRLSLDIIGLPPTPGEVQAFLDDQDPHAYERLVERLLASPHYGERMAVPWLDVVRFADSVGFHGDQEQNIFPYREYVIQSFNENKSFDQFTIEQIAGDLLPNPSPEQLVASGFNRLNMMTREGGAQPREYLAKYAADRVRAVSTAFIGSTLACAECHDHKFDPFTAKDFYAMAAFFADLKQWGVYADYPYTPNADLAGWNNDHPFPPEIEVKSAYLEQRKQRLAQELEKLIEGAAIRLAADPSQEVMAEQWNQSLREFLSAHPDGWETALPETAKSTREGSVLRVMQDGIISISDRPASQDMAKGERTRRQSETIRIAVDPVLDQVGTFRMEFVPDPLNDGRITRGSNPWFNASVRWEIQKPDAEEPELVVVHVAESSAETRNYYNGHLASHEPVKIWSHHSLERKGFHINYYPETPIMLRDGEKLIAIIESRDVGSVRISVSPLGLLSPKDNASDRFSNSIFAEYVRTGATLSQEENARRINLQKEILECRDGYAFTMVSQAVEPRLTRLLNRGDWKDETGEIVAPAPPAFLVGRLRSLDDPRLTRLDLAKWIVARDNPLTARTFVNRLWKQFFGTALSSVTDDLGSQGEWPTHPELLDWLAVEFMDQGWDVKAMVRLIVTSSTYRQSSRRRPDLEEIDPANRLLARQTARRLEAEFVRDNALRIAGLLNEDIGGPSARPYQPAGLYEPLNFPAREYQAHEDERQYRRGLYMHWQRTFLHPMLANFDAPSREECTADRTVSNTPQQAMTLLNDPTFVEAARVMAQFSLIADENLSHRDRIVSLFKRTLARSPDADEIDSLLEYFQGRLSHYLDYPEDASAFTTIGLYPTPEELAPPELAAWTAVARVLLNLHETLVRY